MSANSAKTELHQTKVQAFIAQLQPRDWNRWEEISQPQTIDERWDLQRWFDWPPDVFALTSLLLGISGAYRAGITAPEEPWPDADWPTKCRQEARNWRAWLCESSLAGKRVGPHPLKRYIDIIEELKDLPVNDLFNVEIVVHQRKRREKPYRIWDLCNCLMRLHAIADEAMRGVGTLSAPHVSLPLAEEGDDPHLRIPGIEKLHLQANLLLALRGTLSRIGKHRGIVLPKTRTPQVGLTLRSFSHHLTFHQSEVDVAWRAVPWVNIDENTLNLLIVPWPYTIRSRSFQPELVPNSFQRLGNVRYFSYDPAPESRPGDESAIAFDPLDVVKRVRAAMAECNRVHIVVFPEASLRTRELKQLKRVLERHLHPHEMPLIISGLTGRVRANSPADEGSGDADEPYEGAGFNRVVLSVYYGEKWYDMVQDKHHRWKLDPAQIARYGLSGTLSSSYSWWESIPIPRRRLSVLTSNSWLSLVPLICEDLARLDPVSDLIRGIGPTLLMAILLDGPQLSNRWSARYASSFADDPGTSVLTVNSLGMSRRSIPIGKTRIEAEQMRAKNGNTVALWKDQFYGDHALEAKQSVLLTVATRWFPEETVDMRVVDFSAAFVFQGVHNPRLPKHDTLLADPYPRPLATPSLAPARSVSTKSQNEGPGSASQSDPEVANPIALVEDRKRVKRDLIDMCELSLYTFYVDALVDVQPGEENSLLAWMLSAVGLCLDHDGSGSGGAPSRDGPADTEILKLLRSSIWYRKWVPLDIPTPQFLLALHQVTDLVRGGADSEPGTHRSSPDVRTSRWKALFQFARSEMDRRVEQFKNDSFGSEIDDLRKHFVDLAKTAHQDLPDAKDRGRTIPDFSDWDVGRILLTTPHSVLWALHNRLSLLRRSGGLLKEHSMLLQDLEDALVADFHSPYLRWREDVRSRNRAQS